MMRRSFLRAAIAALALGGVGTVQAQSGDPDRVDRQAALLNAATIQNAFRSVERRIRVTDFANLWEGEWDGRSHPPPASGWWLGSWTERGLTARYCDGVLAVYADDDELKGVGRDHRAVQVAPVAYGGGRTGLHLILRGSRVFRGAHGRGNGSLPACMPVPSATGDRAGLVLAVADPKLEAAGRRWENEDRTVQCSDPCSGIGLPSCPRTDTGTMEMRRRIPIQVSAVTDCPSATPNCNDLREFAPVPPAWPRDCATRQAMLSATPPGLPADAACTDWARWRSNCRIVYAAAPPAADIPDPTITWESGPVHEWTQSCSCPSGETGSCTQHWAQDTEIRVFVLRPGSEAVRTRQPARGAAGRPRHIRTAENCTPIQTECEGDCGNGPDGDEGSTSSSSSSSSSSSAGEVGGIGGVDGGVTGGHAPGQSNSGTGNADSNSDNSGGNGDSGGGGGKPIVLDLDGDGVELVPLEESTAFFDINGDGYRERMGWVSADDGFLAYDKDGDGRIAAHDELSFVSYVEGARTDLEGLRHFDTDGDGLLDPDDAGWGLFRVWQDLDQDGESDPGELSSLDEAGIESISLTSDGVKRTVAGNTVFGEGRYVGPDGPRAFQDVSLGVGERRE